MPITKSAEKKDRRDKKRKEVNHSYLSEMRSVCKNMKKWTKSGLYEKVKEFFNISQKLIDKCRKKSLIHENKARREKSKMALLLKEASK